MSESIMSTKIKMIQNCETYSRNDLKVQIEVVDGEVGQLRSSIVLIWVDMSLWNGHEKQQLFINITTFLIFLLLSLCYRLHES